MAANTKIRIRRAALSGSPSPSQTSNESGFFRRQTTNFRPRARTQFMARLPFRIASGSPALFPSCSRPHSALLASPEDACGRRRHLGLLIHGSAIKCLGKLFRINHLRISNRRLKGGLSNQKMPPVSAQRTQHALCKLKLETQNPVEMKFFRREPFLQVFPRRRFELRHHLAFLHVHQYTLRRHRGRRRDPLSNSSAPCRVRQASVCCEI